MYEDFIEKMYEAFSSAEKPELDEIAPCRHKCLECDEIKYGLHPYNVKDVPDELIAKLNESLPLLSPKALRYYLPRYMEFGLLNQDHIVFELTLYHLTPSKKELSEDYYRERFSVFHSGRKKLF